MALFYHPLPFHPGEISLHQKLHISQNLNNDIENPTIPHLSPLLSRQLQISPLIALGTLDCQGWPVTTLLGKSGGSGSGIEEEGGEGEEEEPLAQPLGRNGVMGIKSQVEGLWDPVVEVLVGGKGDGDGGSGSGSGSEKVVVRREEEGKGRMISGLTIDLERRKRVKFFGRMVVGALGWRRRGEEEDGREESIAEMQLVLKVEQRYGGESIFSLSFFSFSLLFLQSKKKLID